MRTRPGAVVVALALLFGGTAGRAQDRVIDRVLATVNGRVITQSDVQGVQALGLIVPATDSDPGRSVLDAIVDRVLVLEEVERYAPPEPDPAAIDKGVAAVRAAHGPAYQAALAAAGRDETFLRRWVRNTLRIEEYISQRFAGVVEPNEEDVESYRRRQATAGVTAMDDAAASAALTSERRAALVREWIRGLRSRAAVTINPQVP